MANIGLNAILQDQAFQAGLSRYQKGIGQMESATDRGASTMTKVWAGAQKAVVVGAAAAVAGLASIVAVSKQGLDSLIAWGDQVNTLSDNLGTTGEQSSTFAVALNTVGVSVDEGGAGLNFLVRSLDDYGKAVKEGKGDTSQFGNALKKLGVSAFDSRGKMRTFNDLLPDLMDAFQNLPAGIDKTALAMELFGARAGTKFLDFLSQGSEGLAEAQKLAEEFGLTMSTDLSDATEDFTFALNKTNLGLQGFWVTIGKEVLPIATTFVNFINRNILPPLIRWAREIMPILSAQIIRFGDFISSHVIPALRSLWNIAQLLITGDFTGGIFGLTEDSFFIGALLTARDVVVGLFDTLTKRDWAGAWNVITDAASNLMAIFVDQFGDPGALIGDWIDNTVLPALRTELPKLIDAISSFLQTNGPKAWDALKTWGMQFWAWLTEEVLPQVSARVFPLLQSIANWLQNTWDTYVQPTISKWATLFWEWLTGPEGAISMIIPHLVTLSQALQTAIDNPAIKEKVNAAGKAVGAALMTGLGSFFESGEGQTATDSAFDKLIKAFEEADKRFTQSLINLGKEFLKGMLAGVEEEIESGDLLPNLSEKLFNRFVEYLTKNFTGGFGTDFIGAIGSAFETWIKGGLPGLVFRIVDALIKQFRQALKDLGIDLPGVGAPTPTATAAPTSQNFTTAPTSQLQLQPVALQVKIGEQEIKEAVLTWSYEGVNTLFNQAVAQVTGTA